MKKVFNSLFVIIAAMVTFAGCAKQEVAAPEVKTVHFVAESIETKTAFGTPDGTTYPTLWTDNDEKVKIILNLTKEASAEVTASDDYVSASFNAEISADGDGPYVFHVISPVSAYFSKGTSKFTVTIPSTQEPLSNSVDEAAQILYAVSEEYNEMPENVNLTFRHFTAYGNLTFSNLELGDANVTSVSVTSSVPFVNRWDYVTTDGSFAENSGGNTITLTTDKTENLWFACAPIGSMDGKQLTFTINTDQGTLSKTVTLSGDKYKFEAGKIAKMIVNMAGIEMVGPKVYDLLTSEDNLTPESKIIIVACDYDKALGTTQNENNRAGAAVTKSYDKSTITDPDSGVQVITVEDGYVEETVAFNVGTGYLYAAASGSNYLKTENTLSANSSWKVTITEGKANIVAQGANTRNVLMYNLSSSIFSCYASGQKDVAIYKLRGTGAAPLPKLTAPTVTAILNGEETGVDVSWTAVENATSYVVSCTGKDDVAVTETSYSFEDLPAGTYTISVKAKAEGYKSATGTAEAVTVPAVDSGEGEAASVLAYTFDITSFGTSGYGVHKEVASNNNMTWTITCGQGGYLGINKAANQSKLVLGDYLKVGSPIGYTSTSLASAVISDGTMSNIGKVEFVANSVTAISGTAPTSISLVYSADGNTYSLIETQSFNKSDGNTFEFTPKDSGYYAVVFYSTAWFRLTGTKINYYAN